MSRKIETIFQQSMTSNESIPFLFVPECKDKKVVGLLLSSNAELALSFKNGTDLKLNSQIAFQAPHSAPDKRIVSLDEPLENEILQGVITAGEFGKVAGKGMAAKQISVYLIIEQ